MEETEENFLVSNDVTKIIKNTHTPRGSLTTLVYYSMPGMGMVPKTCVQKPRETNKRRQYEIPQIPKFIQSKFFFKKVNNKYFIYTEMEK